MWGKVEQELKCSHKMVGNTQYPLATANARLLTICPWKPPADGGIGRATEIFDNEFFHMVLHNIVHLFFEEWGGWVDGCYPMWFYEGTAHWIEYRLFNEVTAHCSDEAGKQMQVKTKKWEKLVYKMLKEKKDTPLPNLSGVKMQDLTFNMRLKGWSLIDWIYDTGKAQKLNLFVKVLKRSKDEAQAWRDTYGLTMDEVDEQWEKWAKKKYNPRTIRKLEKENEKRLEKFIEHQKQLIKSLPAQ